MTKMFVHASAAGALSTGSWWEAAAAVTSEVADGSLRPGEKDLLQDVALQPHISAPRGKCKRASHWLDSCDRGYIINLKWIRSRCSGLVVKHDLVSSWKCLKKKSHKRCYMLKILFNWSPLELLLSKFACKGGGVFEMLANFCEPAFEWSGFTHLKAVLHNKL